MAREKTARVKRLRWALLLICFASSMPAAERKPLADVDAAALSRQLLTIRQGDGIMAAIWWPSEFWAIALAREPRISPDLRKQMVADLGPYSLLGIVDATAQPTGTFAFSPREVVLKGATIEWSGSHGSHRLEPLKKVPAQLQPLLDNMEPLMRSMVGDLGRNLHIIVVENKGPAGAVLTPYESGSLQITLKTSEGVPREAMVIEAPADALFVTRSCPNGKPAHVTWKVCPWDGTKLPD